MLMPEFQGLDELAHQWFPNNRFATNRAEGATAPVRSALVSRTFGIGLYRIVKLQRGYEESNEVR